MKRTDAPPRSIVHISPTYFDDHSLIGGGERAPVELAKAMAKIAPTELVSFGQKAKRFREGNLTYHIYRPLFYLDGNPTNPLDIRFLKPLMRHSIIHVHQISTIMSNMACLLGIIPQYRIFATDHGGGGRDYARFLPLTRLVRAHLAVSVFAGTHTPLHANHVFPIYSGVDTLKYQPSAEPQKPYALFVGRPWPHKGIDYLIRAVSDDIELVIVGQPAKRRAFGLDKIQYYADLLHMAQGRKVRFIANASDDEVIELYRRATVTVLPSVYDDMYGSHTDVPELFGLALVESMACGTPVICTNVGGMPEIVEDGETGFIVPPNNPQALRHALMTLLADPERAARMGMAARDHVLQHFTWDAVARRCLFAYGQFSRM